MGAKALTLDCSYDGGMADKTAVLYVAAGMTYTHTYTRTRIYVEPRASESVRMIDPSEWRATSGDFVIKWRCGPLLPHPRTGEGRERIYRYQSSRIGYRSMGNGKLSLGPRPASGPGLAM